MVSINVGKIASTLKDSAAATFQKLKENPAEGSIFDAAQKLGINSKEDLQASIARFKEDPKGTAQSAFKTLSEKGFFGEKIQQSYTTGEEEGNREFSVDNIGENITTKATEQQTETKATENKTETQATTATTEEETAVETADETEEAEETTATAENDNGETIVEEQDKEFGGILGKLGIKNLDDLGKGISKLFNNPTETTQSAAQKLGISEEQAKKVASFVSKYTQQS